MTTETTDLITHAIHKRIRILRGCQILLDSDLAYFYQKPTKSINQAARRNPDRFPHDFMFNLTPDEHEQIKTQDGILNIPQQGHHRKHPPTGYSEQGVAMFSSIFTTPQSKQISIAIARELSRNRTHLLTVSALAAQISQLEKAQLVLIETVNRLSLQLSGNTNALAFDDGKAQFKLSPFSTVSKAAIDGMLECVSSACQIKPESLFKLGRAKEIVQPRQLAMYLLRKHTSLSLKEVARIFGLQHHSTVLHACKISANNSHRHALIQKIEQLFQDRGLARNLNSSTIYE